MEQEPWNKKEGGRMHAAICFRIAIAGDGMECDKFTEYVKY
jgi:hypothetical protein